MRIERIDSTLLAENAYVVTAETSNESLIVDPGFGTAAPIEAYLAANDLTASAVLLTHGHPDHVWDAAVFDLPTYIPKPDLYRMDDPMGFLPAGFGSMGQWRKPKDLRTITTQVVQLVPQLPILMIPAPGHTEGSAVFLTEVPASEPIHANFATAETNQPFAVSGQDSQESSQPIAWVGDVIFAGSVGRTDLPGGDETQMRHSLRTLANALNPRTFMLPGHGPATTWSVEQARNPYIRRAKEIG